MLVAPERVAGVYLYRTPDSFGSRTVTETSFGCLRAVGSSTAASAACWGTGCTRLFMRSDSPITKHKDQQECKYQQRDNQQRDLPGTVRPVTLDLSSPAVDHDLKQLAVELIGAGVNR